MRKIIFLMSILLIAQCAQAQKTGTLPPAVSKIQAIIDLIKDNKPGIAKKYKKGSEKEFTITEQELNEYLAFAITQSNNGKKPKSFKPKSAQIRLKEGRLAEIDAIASFDAGALKLLGSDSASGMMKTIKNYLTVDNSLKTELSVNSAKGKAFVKIQHVKIKGLPLPDSILQKVLKGIGDKQKPKIDFAKAIDLPNGIDKIDIQPGLLVLKLKIL